MSPFARLLDRTLKPGLECPLNSAVGWNTVVLVRGPQDGLSGGGETLLRSKDVAISLTV